MGPSWFATEKKRQFGGNVWVCGCGHKEKSRGAMDKHLFAHQAFDEAMADKKSDDELRDEAKREAEQAARKQRWIEMQQERARQAASFASDHAAWSGPEATVGELREQIEAMRERADLEGYLRAMTEVFGAVESQPLSEGTVKTLDWVASRVERTREQMEEL